MKYRSYILTHEGNEIIETHKSKKAMFEYLENSLYSNENWSLYVQTYFFSNIDGHFRLYDSKFNFDNQ
jgi:hypothetical protein